MDKPGFLHLLQKKGLITVEEELRLTAFFEKQAEPETAPASQRVLLGEYILEQEIITRKDLFVHLRDQVGMNPDHDYSEWTFGMSGASLPLERYSGDFFGFFPLGGGLTAVSVCDASGNGLEGGLLAILMESFIQEAIKRKEINASGIVRRMNRASQELGLLGPHIYATLGIMVLDINRGTLDYCNAGAPPLLVYRRASEQIEELNVCGLPLGIYNRYYETDRTLLRRGDVLLMLSDGACKAQSWGGRLYGLEGVKVSLRDHANKNHQKIRNALMRDVRFHSMMRKRNDDITFMVIKKVPRRYT